jgi:enoyl-CoA hydratase/3-hydroxyacyl-CoA dehydrogenase
MILFPIVNEACRVLEEGVVIRASDLDIASVLGMSFPSYRYVLPHLLLITENSLYNNLESSLRE